MPLYITTAVVLCIVVNCVHVESQVPLPLPTLTLGPAVNASNIVMFSQVKLICTIPEKAPFPVSVFISRADNPVENHAYWAHFSNLQTPDTITFTISANPEMEGALVCWYKSSRTRETSGLSNSVDIVINTVPNPLMTLIPSPIFPVGGTYVVQCEIPSNDLRNVTLNLYARQLPLSPGNMNFSFIGSRVLLPGEWGASINRTNVVQSVEYACKMEVFYKGKVFLSISSPVAAIPDELPARLYSSANESCAGYLSLKVKEVWRSVCFQSRYADIEEHLANVVCREVNCGHALTWNKQTDTSLNFFGTPRCTGKENRIAECPIIDPKDCEIKSLYVICSDAFHPPKLSVIGHGSGPWVYIRSEESASLRCALESRAMEKNDIWVYFTITYQGLEFTTSNTRSDFTGSVWSIGYEMTPRVKEGEFACFARLSSSRVKTENSNSIHIYIYDPPPAGAVAAAVITTLAGAAIIFYICVFRTSLVEVVPDQPAGRLPSDVEISDPVIVRPPLCC